MATSSQVFPFLRAAYEGRIADVKAYLEDGISIDSANQSGLQAIHFATKMGNVELVEELIKQGASVDAASLKGNTPLHVAALMGRTQVLKLLLRNGAEVNRQSDCEGDLFTPLYMASQIGHQEIVTLLLAHGADPTIVTSNGSSPRDVAQQQGFHVVAEILSEYEKRTQGGHTAETSSDNEDSQACASGNGEAPNLGLARLKKYGPPPVCLDLTASPKCSPKKFNNTGARSKLAGKTTTNGLT